MKKIIFIISILGFIGIDVIIFQFSNPTIQTSIDKGNPVQATPGVDIAEREVRNDKGQVGEKPRTGKITTLNLNERHRKVWACKELLEERKSLGLSISDAPDTGMIESEKAIQIAVQHSQETSNTNQAPEVALVDGFYIISYKNHDNPFRVGDPGDDCRIAIDAQTGEFISTEDLNRGVVGIGTSRKTGAGMVDESSQAEEYSAKLFNGLKELHRRVLHGQPLKSDPQPRMIALAEAIKVAMEQVSDRDYDQNKEPLAILVDDVYIVTFWENDADKLPDGWKSYDSRVGIDANTGEFIAMEITRKNHIPIGEKE